MIKHNTGASCNELLRRLPSVDELLRHAMRDAGDWVTLEGHRRVVTALRHALQEARAMIRAGAGLPDDTELLATARAYLESHARAQLLPVINATGVIVHTNLGRAVLSRAAIQAMDEVAAGYSMLEFDLEQGTRGRRGEAVEQLVCELTGAEAALVVNNCAGATLLMLSAIAHGTAVVISRGQLVEIGGGFRIPDILRQSGAQLLEVGTTNRTRLADYEQAILERRRSAGGDRLPVGAVLRVHASNFKMVGFTEQVEVGELVTLTRKLSEQAGEGMSNALIPVLDDVGSGALIDMSQFGLSREPMPQDSVRAGAAIVTFSGDKLLGGPQAGILAGRRASIEKCRRHPLARALRADKLTLAGLGATLLHYARGEAVREVPVLRMIALPAAEIATRARRVMADLAGVLDAHGVRAELIAGQSTVGGGSLPGETLPTWLIALSGNAPDALAKRLRRAPTPVIARIQNERVMLDLRTVQDDQALTRAIVEALAPSSASSLT
ncbi:MAG: L-seryl-tRNA(Sec) selenium transferase [Anaerolineae bacterium]|nr:L-seryl-tRNA(Sec) selenium transferase [Thermoflexales bacterium]MDW8406601.1 L-seryl-tRNA(Sec) selenium transferase [Anaerolineae bacterium]